MSVGGKQGCKGAARGVGSLGRLFGGKRGKKNR